ncbi:transglutaminase TgpA family protein [Nitrincola sp. MINF-07-Sa-05]|uniref:transglutaminase TgpA family protein n=1 Tax=Nitrincola salilacus TaxID=3400273 RepID=UPI003917DD4C
MKQHAQQISRAAVVWQLVAFVAVVVPHLIWMPYWIPLFCVAMIACRLMIHSGRWSFPHWSVKLLLVLITAAGLLLTFDKQSLLSGTVSLLVLALSLKLLEIYHRRDALVLIYVAYFVATTTFLFEQEMWMALLCFIAILLVTAALNSVWQDPQRVDYKRPLVQSFRVLLPSVPLMLLLFLLFPRIEPLWSVQLDRSAAVTGLSDTMAPGDVSQLTRSAAMAFRVVFDGEPPPPAQRYWRAMVYSQFDGRQWSQASLLLSQPAESLTPLSEPFEYQIIQERTGRNWLFALDMPMSSGIASGGIGNDKVLTRTRTLESKSVIESRQHYRLQSSSVYQLGIDLSDDERARYTRIPASSNPRTQALSEQLWQAADQQPERYIDELLNLFNREFTYTLQPPRMEQHSIDQFMLEHQRGFCEHFAGAFAFMLRNVGIPARVVGGYQGGEWNPYQGYLLLRQYDAHAWTEAWLEGEGWVRIDPTAAVAPQRIEQSLETLFADDPEFMADNPVSALRVSRSGLLLQMRLYYEGANFAWHRWVLHYQGEQEQLLRNWLGDLNPLRMILALMIPASLVLGWVAWTQLRQTAVTRRDPVDQALHRLLERLAQKGIPRHPEESLQSYCVRLAEERPDLSNQLRQMALLDETQRYGQNSSPEHRRELLGLIRACHKSL